MRCYLVQHGKSLSEAEDPSRALTKEGIDESTRTSEFLSQIGLSLSLIQHSGKARAQQTATILAGCLEGRTEQIKGLAPLDDPELMANLLGETSHDVMLVGHLPHLEGLASILLTGRADQKPVRFRNSGIVCLERNEDKTWSLVWLITPELVGATGGQGTFGGQTSEE